MANLNLRQLLGQQIMEICAGHPTEDTLIAQAEALATAIGGLAHMSGMSLPDAGQLLNDLHKQMQTHVVQNWGQIARGDH
jgi:hypothetical protein